MKIAVSIASGLAALLLAGSAMAQDVTPPAGHNAQASANPAEQTTSAGRNIELKPRAGRPASAARPAPEPAPAMSNPFQNIFGGAPAQPSPQARPAGNSRDRWANTTPQDRVRAKTFFGLYKIVPRETVDFREKHAPGTIIVRSSERRLYYVLGDGKALRYAIGIGREGAAWAGTSTVSDKREWPAWTPTPAILARQPDLPRHMEGGPKNPLGARALYLGQTMYRIHGTNEPWMIGEAASAGCIRMTNDDAIDLYNRTRIGATVIVLR